MTTATAPPPVAVLWTLEDVRTYLRIGRTTAHMWVKAGKLPPPMRIGRRMLWDPEQIRALLTSSEG